MMPAFSCIRCGKSADRSPAFARINMLPVANVCIMLLPFLLVCSPRDMLRVFNIATSPKAAAPSSVQIRVSNQRVAVAVGSSMLASDAPAPGVSGFPPTVSEALAAWVRTQPDADIVVQPDASATYADVVGVLDTLQGHVTWAGHRVVVAPVSAP